MTTMAAPTASRFDYVTANDVFAKLTDGTTIRIEEWHDGIVSLAEQLARRDSWAGFLVLDLGEDSVAGTSTDCVSVDPDTDDRVTLFNRGIRALENARDALLATGYSDDARA
jgi:hypothetical protein